MPAEPRAPGTPVTVVLLAFGVALGSISAYLGIVVGDALTKKHHQEEIRRLRVRVATLRAELKHLHPGNDRRPGA